MGGAKPRYDDYKIPRQAAGRLGGVDCWSVNDNKTGGVFQHIGTGAVNFPPTHPSHRVICNFQHQRQITRMRFVNLCPILKNRHF